jgi:hypothetical protein
MEIPMRVLGIGLAVALAVALLAQGLSTADAADKGKSPKKGGFTPDEAATMTAIALAESKKKKGLNAKARSKAGSGSDISPWTVTHGGSGARYHKAPKSKALCTSPGSGKPRAC